MRLAAQSEKDFLQQVTTLAGLCGWLCYHPLVSIGSTAGYPDLCMTRPGSPLIFSELKSQSGTLTPKQVQWLEILKQSTGIEAHVWRPSDWDAIARLLQQRPAR